MAYEAVSEPVTAAPHAAHDPHAAKHVVASAAAVAKILVVGPTGVGKTTFIRSVSEIPPLSTEATMTQAGAETDRTPTPSKTTTTVALDFGRLTVGEEGDEIVLYLFGTPGQERFLPAWRDLARGAVGALALIDTGDLASGFEALNNVEDLDLPYAIATNAFPHSPGHPDGDLRESLDLEDDTPLVALDARDPVSCTRALIALVDHLLTLEPPR